MLQRSFTDNVGALSPPFPPNDSSAPPAHGARTQSSTTGLLHSHALLGTLIYGVAVSLLSWQHALWRDEVRGINIASACDSPLSLVACLKNEGHPPLWYLVLHLAHRLAGTLLVLKPVSVLVASAATYLFLRYSPFRRSWKMLFLIGYFPLFEYSVRCRNYGLGMLLLFATAVFYRTRFSRPWRLAIILALLANTNAFGLVCAVALLVCLLLEQFLLHRPCGLVALISSGGIGVALSIATVIPDSAVTVLALPNPTTRDWIARFLVALVWPTHFATLDVGKSTSMLLFATSVFSGVVLLIAFWFLIIQLFNQPWRALSLYLSAIGCTMVDFVYPIRTRQLGQFLMFLIFLLWTEGDSPPWRALPERLASIARRTGHLLRAVGVACLVVHAGTGVAYVGRELLIPQSHCRSLGELITQHRELANAIVVGEPDLLLEALPYYANVPIYQPRERAYFVDRVRFTSASRSDLTLDELLAEAKRLQKETQRPILLVIGHRMRPEGPYTLRAGYMSHFHYSRSALLAFTQQVTTLASFDGSQTDENFTVYLLHS